MWDLPQQKIALTSYSGRLVAFRCRSTRLDNKKALLFLIVLKKHLFTLSEKVLLSIFEEVLPVRILFVKDFFLFAC